MTLPLARKTLAYGLISAFCFSFHNLIMILGDHAGLPVIGGVMISFVLVTLTAYLLHSLFTFRAHFHWLALARYMLAMGMNVPLTFVMTWVLRRILGLPMELAAPLASASMVAVNFLLSRWAIARHARPAGASER